MKKNSIILVFILFIFSSKIAWSNLENGNMSISELKEFYEKNRIAVENLDVSKLDEIFSRDFEITHTDVLKNFLKKRTFSRETVFGALKQLQKFINHAKKGFCYTNILVNEGKGEIFGYAQVHFPDWGEKAEFASYRYQVILKKENGRIIVKKIVSNASGERYNKKWLPKNKFMQTLYFSLHLLEIVK